VGPVDGDPRCMRTIVEKLEQSDGERVNLFARRASRHPDAQVVLGSAVLDERRKDDALERIETRGLTKERGDADQQILIERLDGGAVFPQEVAVAAKAVVVAEEHAPQDAPLDGGPFEVAEVDRMAALQQLENAIELRGGRRHGRSVFRGSVMTND